MNKTLDGRKHTIFDKFDRELEPYGHRTIQGKIITDENYKHYLK